MTLEIEIPIESCVGEESDAGDSFHISIPRDPVKENDPHPQESEKERGGASEVPDSEDQPSSYEPPNGGWGWVVVIASFFCNFIVDGIIYSYGIFFPHFVRYYGAPSAQVSWVGSLLSGCSLCIGPVASALTNRFGCRVVMVTGSVIACGSLLLSTLAPNVEVLMFTYGVFGGTGLGLIFLPSVVAVGKYFSTRRALATGIAVCGSGVGAFAFAPLCQMLLEFFDWKGALIILAALSLVCAAFASLIKPLEPNSSSQNTSKNYPPPTETVKPVENKDATTCVAVPESNEIRNWKCSRLRLLDFSLLKNRGFLVSCIYNVTATIGFYVPYFYITDFSLLKGIPSDKATSLLSVIGVANTIGRVIFGYITDKPCVDALLVNNISIGGIGISIFVVPWCTSYFALLAACILFGLSASAYISLTSTVAIHLVGVEEISNAFGLINFFRGAACMVGPPIAGTLYDQTGSYDVPFYVAGIFLAISSILSFTVPWSVRIYPNAKKPPLETDIVANTKQEVIDTYQGFISVKDVSNYAL